MVNKRISVKKVLLLGSAGIKFVLDTRGVTSLVLGSINASHLEQNVLAASEL